MPSVAQDPFALPAFILAIVSLSPTTTGITEKNTMSTRLWPMESSSADLVKMRNMVVQPRPHCGAN